MAVRDKINTSLILQIALIGLTSALTFLPNVTRFTYYRDDWYYILAGRVIGPEVFHAMFQSDRPARGVLFELLFRAFGPVPLAYNASSYLWRLLSGVSALWLFKLLWPKGHKAPLWAAILFTLYPGYHWWVAGVEYQPMILSLLLQVSSIALAVQAVKSTHRVSKILWVSGALVTGGVYLAFVEYSIGMEVFRILCIFIVMSQVQVGLSFTQKWAKTLRTWVIFAFIPVVFLIWRLFIFRNLRAETDLSLQLDRLTSSPLLTGLWWLVRLFQSTVNEAFLAWGTPLYRNFFSHDCGIS